MKKIILSVMMTAVLAGGLGGAVVLAQNGGKAEPNRIKFPRNSNAGTVTGTVRGDEEAEYVFGARGGQTVTVAITDKPEDTIEVVLTSPSGNPVELEGGSATLPEDGDFMLVVKKKKAGGRASSYTVKLSIR